MPSPVNNPAFSPYYNQAAATVPVVGGQQTQNFSGQGAANTQQGYPPPREEGDGWVKKGLIGAALVVAAVAGRKAYKARDAFKVAGQANNFNAGEHFVRNLKFWKWGGTDDAVAKFTKRPSWSKVEGAENVFRYNTNGKMVFVQNGQPVTVKAGSASDEVVSRYNKMFNIGATPDGAASRSASSTTTTSTANAITTTRRISNDQETLHQYKKELATLSPNSSQYKKLQQEILAVERSIAASK